MRYLVPVLAAAMLCCTCYADDAVIDMSAVEGIDLYENQIPADLPNAKSLRQKPQYPVRCRYSLPISFIFETM